MAYFTKYTPGRAKLVPLILAVLAIVFLFLSSHESTKYRHSPRASSLALDFSPSSLPEVGEADLFYGSISRKQQAEGTCAPDAPCVNGACCSSTGICGYCEFLPHSPNLQDIILIVAQLRTSAGRIAYRTVMRRPSAVSTRTLQIRNVL